MSGVVELTNYHDHDNFIDNNDKCIIFFGSQYCHHCHDMIPVFEQMAQDYPEIAFGHIEVTKVKVENIDGVPVFVIYKNKQPIDVVLGANKDKLLNIINYNFKIVAKICN